MASVKKSKNGESGLFIDEFLYGVDVRFYKHPGLMDFGRKSYFGENTKFRVGKHGELTIYDAGGAVATYATGVWISCEERDCEVS